MGGRDGSYPSTPCFFLKLFSLIAVSCPAMPTITSISAQIHPLSSFRCRHPQSPYGNSPFLFFGQALGLLPKSLLLFVSVFLFWCRLFIVVPTSFSISSPGGW